MQKIIVNNKLSYYGGAKKYNLHVIDLFEIAISDPLLHNEDKVHFTDDGYKALAECILENVEL